MSTAKAAAKISIRKRWCMRLIAWLEHIRRHPDSPSFALLLAQDDGWLRERRREVGSFGNSRTAEAGKTQTRAGPGFPIRFFSNWLEALDSQGVIVNPSRSKDITKAGAERLYKIVFDVQVSPLAIQDG